MSKQLRPDIEAMPELGKLATVIIDSESYEPRTVGASVASDYFDIGPGFMDDLRVVSHWAFHVALYALQNPSPESIDRALELVTCDCEDWLDEETMRPRAVPPPVGFAYNKDDRSGA